MISVVIPTLNEAEHLPLTLECIRANAAAHEIIVADGGSTDATREVAAARDRNLSVKLLRTLNDIDQIEEWQNFSGAP